MAIILRRPDEGRAAEFGIASGPKSFFGGKSSPAYNPLLIGQCLLVALA
jgi:hypothetical protein